MDFLPGLATLATFTAASLLLFLTPGPDMSLFLARTLSSGRSSGIATIIGTNIGCLIHTCLAAIGVSALVAASATAFFMLKIVGALYLLWLAYNALRHGSSFTLNAERQPASLHESFFMGLTINLINPKVALFFITFLPQFVSATDPHVTSKLFFLGVWFVLVSIPPSLIMIWGAARLVNWLQKKPTVLRGIDLSFAAVFAFFALRIVMTQGK
jgi:threonine/homoserine/homoserine lactone efflux protein